jgi:hypothetical protein
VIDFERFDAMMKLLSLDAGRRGNVHAALDRSAFGFTIVQSVRRSLNTE